VILPSGHWQRAVITALLVIPLVLVVLLTAPAWLVMPFLSESRRNSVLDLLDRLIDWIKAIHGSGPPPAVGQGRAGQARLPGGRRKQT